MPDERPKQTILGKVQPEPQEPEPPDPEELKKHRSFTGGFHGLINTPDTPALED